MRKGIAKLFRRRTTQRGVSLVELMTYIGVASIILIGVLAVLLLLTQSWLRARSRAAVEENARIATERMKAEVEGAQDITAPRYQSAVLNSGPVAYWRLNESIGSTIAKDITANAMDGTYTASPSLAQLGIVSDGDAAVTLNGSTQYVDRAAADGSVLDIDTNPVTLEAWMKPGVVSGLQSIIVRGRSGTDGYGLLLNGASVRIVGGAGSSDSTGIMLVAGTWYHVVGVINGSSSKIYVNGVDRTSGIPTINVAAASAIHLLIGASRNATDTGVINFFNGTIDEVIVYNRALPLTEIQTHYNQGAGNYLSLDAGKTGLNYSGYAWSAEEDPLGSGNQAGIGWISSNCTGQPDLSGTGGGNWSCAQAAPYTNYAVTRSLDTLSGFALTENTGFISFNCRTSPNADSCRSSDYKVTIDADGEYHGWAWGDQIGWISMNCADQGICATKSNYKVYETKTATGVELHGWAWSENYGWISFNCDNTSVCGGAGGDWKVSSGLTGGGLTAFSVVNGAWAVSSGAGAPQNLTDLSNVLIEKCANWLGYFHLAANPAPARAAVDVCFQASYRGPGSATAGYSTTVQSTFQLR